MPFCFSQTLSATASPTSSCLSSTHSPLRGSSDLFFSLADQFAANGYFTAMPDLFHGDAMPLNHPADFDFMEWLVPAHLPANVDPIIESTIRYIREEVGIEKIGGAGYCFGAKVCCLLRTLGPNLCHNLRQNSSLCTDKICVVRDPVPKRRET